MKNKKTDYLENETQQSSTATAPKSGKKASKLSALFKSRKFKRGWMSILLTVIFIAVIVGLNIVTTMLSNRFSLSVDLTSNNAYELTEPSVEYLTGLDKDINIYVLSAEKNLESLGEYYVQANKLIHKFEQTSDKVSLEYINLAQNPTFTSKFPDINWQSSSYIMIVACGDEYRGVKADDIFEYDQEALSYYGEYVVKSQKVEQGVITAMLNVTAEEKIGVTILNGHGEQDSTAISNLLESNAYSVENVSLLNAKISDDSQFVLLYAPSNDIDKDAYDTLTDWLYNSGNYGHTLIYMPNDQTTGDTPYIDALLEEWGMTVSKSYTFETDSKYMTNSPYPYLISIFDYSEQDFSSKLRDTSIPVVMMYTLAIDINDQSAVTPLLTTSSSAVKMPLTADESWDYKEEEPLSLCGAAISTQSDADEKNSSNVIVFGSYSAFSQSALSATSFNNASYLVNIFNTIAERDEVGITIEGKPLDNSELGNTSSFTTSMLGALFMYILPIAVIVIGIIIWIRRRHR